VLARPIGVFWMKDEKGPDAKIISVVDGDPDFERIRQLDDLPRHLLDEIEHFFNIYKDLEPGKSSSTAGFEGWRRPAGRSRRPGRGQPRRRVPLPARTPREPAARCPADRDDLSLRIRLPPQRRCLHRRRPAAEGASPPTAWGYAGRRR
jgi:hypothetical protein